VKLVVQPTDAAKDIVQPMTLAIGKSGSEKPEPKKVVTHAGKLTFDAGSGGTVNVRVGSDGSNIPSPITMTLAGFDSVPEIKEDPTDKTRAVRFVGLEIVAGQATVAVADAAKSELAKSGKLTFTITPSGDRTPLAIQARFEVDKKQSKPAGHPHLPDTETVETTVHLLSAPPLTVQASPAAPGNRWNLEVDAKLK
jgi:hypothetical protein